MQHEEQAMEKKEFVKKHVKLTHVEEEEVMIREETTTKNFLVPFLSSFEVCMLKSKEVMFRNDRFTGFDGVGWQKWRIIRNEDVRFKQFAKQKLIEPEAFF